MLTLIQITPQYYEDVRILRNDDRVQDGFIKKSNISTEDQIKYMDKFQHCYWVCLKDDVFAGYIGVIEEDIRICTHPDYQRQGIGFFMVQELIKMHPTAFAKIKLENEISLKLFEKAGFVKKYYILEKL